jgi:glucose-6-phosphate isomerase
MPHSRIGLHYRNVAADIIGDEHGITSDKFKALADETSPIIERLNEERKAGQTPFRDLPYDQQVSQRVKELAGMLKDDCENLVALGIGGSALGNIALQTALNPYMYNLDDSQRAGPRLFVFDNIDPPQFASFLDWIDDKLGNTVFNVISKSGRTAETASQLMIVRQRLLDKFGPAGFQKHVVATADPKLGTLRKIATEAGLRTLEVPEGVGGRFSVLSAVGLFSACMCGIDIDQLLSGA